MLPATPENNQGDHFCDVILFMQSVEHWQGFPRLVTLKEHNTASSSLGMKTLAFLKVL